MNTTEQADLEVDRITSEKLMADLRVVAFDVEQLLKATAGQTGQHLVQARASAAESLKACKARISELQSVTLAKTRAAGRATDVYVRRNPWWSVAICAIAGFAVGALLARSGASDS